MKEKKFILGVAGYIASGKTEAGKFLQKLGAGFIEADEVVNGLYRQGGDGYRKIVSYFGRDYLKKDGEINRRTLAAFVFSDPRKLKILNGLIHPLVHAEILRLISKRRERVVAIEAAYFDKGGLGGVVDKILWIECGRALLKRRAARKGVKSEMFEKILACQSRPEKVDFVVENDGSKAALHRQLKKIYESLRMRSAAV